MYNARSIVLRPAFGNAKKSVRQVSRLYHVSDGDKGNQRGMQQAQCHADP